ncbi:hypothetical protein RHCRD62_20119 [Rhodococcus sp. RD6.2]|nr:hypothetical protein RHCRD62_20119 [Rhodococcus sp. RD6.2]
MCHRKYYLLYLQTVRGAADPEESSSSGYS